MLHSATDKSIGRHLSMNKFRIVSETFDTQTGKSDTFNWPSPKLVRYNTITATSDRYEVFLFPRGFKDDCRSLTTSRNSVTKDWPPVGEQRGCSLESRWGEKRVGEIQRNVWRPVNLQNFAHQLYCRSMENNWTAPSLFSQSGKSWEEKSL